MSNRRLGVSFSLLGVVGLLTAWCLSVSGADLVLVENGAARASIRYVPAAGGGDRRRKVTDQAAATMLADYLKRMSGAELAVTESKAGTATPTDAPVILVGAAALAAGCPTPPKTASGDGYRVQRDGNRLFLVGETPESTYFAASHFLETLGCRWFFSNPIGTVVPDMPTVTVGDLAVEETPDFIYRSLWGPNWRDAEWTRHSRLGGVSMSMGHNWGQVPAKEYGEEHPEYYALRNGERRPGSWVCTSNPDVQRIFSQNVCAAIAGKGVCSFSLSPPDGRGYCQCEQCTALDDPSYLEPSSGTVVMSDRYLRFFNVVAAAAAKANPEAILNFYAYADYSQPAIHAPRAPDNLCVWVAPIRFCRFHALDNPACESRLQLRDNVLSGWTKKVSKLGWREYNYNLAEATVPYSKTSVLRRDIPYLKSLGCIGVNLECLAFWHLYGPHTYLATRLLWDADADVDAVLDDFYTRFCGPAAAHVKAYWERVDRAYRDTDAHAGSFFAIHRFWTPEMVKACQADLTAARNAADTDLIRQRVDMFQMGLDNAKHYLALREAANRCDWARAKEIYEQLLAHMDATLAQRIHRIGEYKHGYLPRFVGKAVTAGAERVTGPNRFLVQLPDEWWFRYDRPEDGAEYDPAAKGAAAGWFAEDFRAGDDWRKVRTYSSTLTDQGVPEELTWMWYRVEFEVPKIPEGQRTLIWFAEIDGRSTVAALNGKVVGAFSPNRKPVEADVTGTLRKGRNTLVLATNHERISELMLGGILKPVMIYATTQPARTTSEQ